MQFIVISLKTGFFQGSEALVGVYRDQGANSSKVLTLDVCVPIHTSLSVCITNSHAAAQVLVITIAFLFSRFHLPMFMGKRRVLSIPQPVTGWACFLNHLMFS